MKATDLIYYTFHPSQLRSIIQWYHSYYYHYYFCPLFGPWRRRVVSPNANRH